ncbi:hypothetical protein FACS189434_11580 [Bacteroidia bacterium]|nr:hypothetical protein FACS189434_11580 [Bacteroidia bacterium]
MKEISEFWLSRLRNEGHFQFMTEVKDLIGRQEYTALRAALGAVWTRFATDLAKEDLAMEKIRKSVYTKTIEQYDKVRDAQHHALGILIDGYLNSPEASVAGNAQQVKIVYNAYGSMARKTLNEETAAITNLCTDLLAGGGAILSALGLKDLTERLLATNNSIINTINLRGDETADKDAVSSVADIRQIVDEDYRQMTTVLQTLTITLPADEQQPIEQLITYLNNSIIARYKQLLKTTGKKTTGTEGGEEEIVEEEIIEQDIKIIEDIKH